MHRLNIVCAESVLFGKEAFSTLGEVRVLPDRAIGHADLIFADVLAIRSKTRVDHDLLRDCRVKFVGTATAGFDHIDVRACEELGVHWSAAPGCNANSVSEYVTAALLHLAVRYGVELEGKTLAVVGVGQVGRRVVAKARALDLRVLQNDPPRAERENNFELQELADILPQADIVTLHVPLTDEGPHATWGMADEAFFARLKPGAVFINASRGEVVEERDLKAALASGRVSHAVLDVWNQEPTLDFELASRVTLGTPHIAGYSYDGKLDGTVQIYEAACRVFGVEPSWDPAPLLPPPSVPRLELDALGRSDAVVLHELVRSVYDLEADDRALRVPPEPDDLKRAARFERLRKTYPERREFFHTEAVLRNPRSGLLHKIHGLGFRLGA